MSTPGDEDLAQIARRLRATAVSWALIQAGPAGRTLASLAEEHDWTRAEALAAFDLAEQAYGEIHFDPATGAFSYRSTAETGNGQQPSPTA